MSATGAVRATLPRVVAVTGLGSFAGRGLVQRLLDRDDAPLVVGIDRRSPSELRERIRFYEIDLGDPTVEAALCDALIKEGVEAIVHASLGEATGRGGRPREVIGCLNLMHAANGADVDKWVALSTAQVYGALPDHPPLLREDRELAAHPRSSRLRETVEIERLLDLYGERHPERIVTVLRPCWVIGARFDGAHLQHFAGKRVWTALGFDPLLQFLHEEDWLDALELALVTRVRGAVNLAGAGPLRLSTLLALAGKQALSVPHPLLERLPPRLRGALDASFSDFLRFGWTVDTHRAAQELGLRPRYSTKEAWMSFVLSQRLDRYR